MGIRRILVSAIATTLAERRAAKAEKLRALGRSNTGGSPALAAAVSEWTLRRSTDR